MTQSVIAKYNIEFNTNVLLTTFLIGRVAAIKYIKQSTININLYQVSVTIVNGFYNYILFYGQY